MRTDLIDREQQPALPFGTSPARLVFGPSFPHHGTRWGYQCGCACTRCRVANAEYQAARRRRLMEGRPLPGSTINGDRTARLIRQLTADGFSARVLARRAGLGARTILRHTSSRPVTLRTAALVRRFWLAQQPGDEVEMSLPTSSEPRGLRHAGCGGQFSRGESLGEYVCGTCGSVLFVGVDAREAVGA